LLSRVL
jgi:hypothetical protein